MIDVYYWPTPNAWKVTIMLEECGLEYQVHEVNIGVGDQFKPDFLKISPNNRMPAIIDHAPLGGGAPLSLFESAAIVEYLADKTGRFLPTSGAERYKVLQWVYWQMANLGPMMGNANHFLNYAPKIADDPAQLQYGQKRFGGEVDRLCGVMDAQLSVHAFIAGADYSIADMMSWPWAMLLEKLIDATVWEKFPHLKRWVDEVGARPAVQRGRQVAREWGERPLTEAQEQARRELLFNQSNDKVRAAREAAVRALNA
jgi:GST-like protein